MKIDKPFKSYNEQVKLIKKKNVTIEDVDFAKKVLSDTSYYTLINGYKDSRFYKKDEDKFIDGITFDMLYTIRRFDNSLNSLLLKYILMVEKSLKTKLAYLIGRKYGVVCNSYFIKDANPKSDYLHKNHYSNSNKRRSNILSSIRNFIDKDLKPRTASKYYKEEKGYVPPWILINDITLGMTIQWYFILKDVDKAEIVEQFLTIYDVPLSQQKYFFRSSLSLIRTFRNSIAHGTKTFAFTIPKNYPVKILNELVPYGIFTKEDLNLSKSSNGLLIILILIMLLINNDTLIQDFLDDLKIIFKKFPNYNFPNGLTMFDIFNLPEDILDKLELLQNLQ